MSKYSIVFQTSETVIETVKVFKEELYARIGWYPSKNSLAHITICEFEHDMATYEIIKAKISNYCRYQNTFEVQFNSFGNYTNGAFFIAPELESKAKMVAIMKEIPKEIKFPVSHKSVDPHISIGRKLSEEQLKIAYTLVEEIDLNFCCEGITIRIFNTERKQYDVLETIPFKGEIAPTKQNWTLF